MRVLIVAATEGELARVVTAPSRHQVTTLVTGVGMVATATHVSRALAREAYDLALNVGLCGAFDRPLTLGTVVHVVRDHLSELGVEDGATFVPAAAIGLIAPDEAPYVGGHLVNHTPPLCAALDALPRVTGITVNTVHGDERSIAAVVSRCEPQVESMEGAAFLYACLVAGLPCAQVRAVSNYVERRNRAAWKIPEALEALGRATTEILRQL
jgi:futalosine hydrolase